MRLCGMRRARVGRGRGERGWSCGRRRAAAARAPRAGRNDGGRQKHAFLMRAHTHAGSARMQAIHKPKTLPRAVHPGRRRQLPPGPLWQATKPPCGPWGPWPAAATYVACNSAKTQPCPWLPGGPAACRSARRGGAGPCKCCRMLGGRMRSSLAHERARSFQPGGALPSKRRVQPRAARACTDPPI